MVLVIKNIMWYNKRVSNETKRHSVYWEQVIRLTQRKKAQKGERGF